MRPIYWAIEKIKRRIQEELLKMADVLGQSIFDHPFIEILNFAEINLLRIRELWQQKKINPNIRICTCPSYREIKADKKIYRIGFYPVAANPFHWAHFLIGLSVMAEFKLDKVIFIIAGFDSRKPALAPAVIRHGMGKEVLKIFAPLFGYSSIAMGSNCDGESNLFRILDLNHDQKIEAFYIAGGDHYHRINPKNNLPDTIQKLENNIITRRGNNSFNQVNAVFIARGKIVRKVNTFLPVYFLPAMPFEASSTMIREALQTEHKKEVLALLPFTAYELIKKFDLYSPYPHYIEPVYKNSGLSTNSAFGQL